MKNNEENILKSRAEKIAPLTSANLKVSRFYANLDKMAYSIETLKNIGGRRLETSDGLFEFQIGAEQEKCFGLTFH